MVKSRRYGIKEINGNRITATRTPVLSVSEFNRFKRENEENKCFELIKKQPKLVEIPVQNNYETLKEEILDIAIDDDINELRKNLSNLTKEYVKKYIEDKEILHKIVEKGALKITEILIQEYDVNIDLKNYEGFTPLHIAVMEGRMDLVKMLIENKANPNELEPDYYMNSMYLALKKGEYNIASYLLKNGAQVYEKDADGEWDFCTNFIIRKIFLMENKSHEVQHFINLLNKVKKPY